MDGRSSWKKLPKFQINDMRQTLIVQFIEASTTQHEGKFYSVSEFTENGKQIVSY